VPALWAGYGDLAPPGPGYYNAVMNQHVRDKASPVRIGASVCPHDCPSACALEVELIDDRTIGRVRGAADNSYTAGVVCAKVGRYAERIHHPDRLLQPRVRKGAKGSGEWASISWDAPLWTSWRRRSCRSRRATARRRSGPTIMPEPWAW
jgi:anaerobic selenocysteine-containing dehydrogenase